MQDIKNLLSAKFVKKYISEHAPDFAKKHDLSDLTVKPIKRKIGKNFHHIVARYDAASIENNPVFCSTSSDHSRKSAFEVLKFINTHGFKNTGIFLPKPLFFEKEMAAFFYQGVDGKNLLHYIKQNIDLTDYIGQTAQWIAHLHNTPIKGAEKLNQINSRIETVVPGPEKFLAKIEKKFPNHFKDVSQNFKALVEWENKDLKTLKHLYLIHGDFHPENVIINKTDGKISGIDFTDICLADWARDIGNFLQQFGFMSSGKLEKEDIQKYKNQFLEKYLSLREIKQTKEIEKRINIYMAWTALRSAIYFLVKAPAEPDNAKTVLKEVNKYINL